MPCDGWEKEKNLKPVESTDAHARPASKEQWNNHTYQEKAPIELAIEPRMVNSSTGVCGMYASYFPHSRETTSRTEEEFVVIATWILLSFFFFLSLLS